MTTATLNNNTITSPDPIEPQETSTAKLDSEGLLLKDPKAALELHIKKIQTLILGLKDRNIKGDRRQAISTEFEAAIESYITLVSACITNNIITNDKTGILKADASNKYFKGYCGHINKVAKSFLDANAKIEAYKGAPLSETEVAKLIETPYEFQEKPTKPLVEDTTIYDDEGLALVDKEEVPDPNGIDIVEIECTDGSKITVDKTENVLYTDIVNSEGEVLSIKRKVLLLGLTWYETAKNIITGILGFVWSLAKTVGNFTSVLIGGAIGSLTASGKVLGTGVVLSIFKFKSDIATSHKRAKALVATY